MKPTHRNPLLRNFFLAATICLSFGQAAHAAALTWTGADGDWETGQQGGWSAVWAAADTGTFNGPGGTVMVKSAITTGAADLAFNAGNYSLTAASPFSIALGFNVKVSSGVTTNIGQNVTLTRAAGASIQGGGTLKVATDGTFTQTTANASEVAGGTTLHLDGGSASFVTSLVIGKFNAGSAVNGTLLVDSGSLTISSGNLNVGRSNGDTSTATLNGGTITVAAGNLNLGSAATSTSKFNLNGGTLSARAVTDANTTSTFFFNGGTLKASSGATPPFMSGLDTVQVRNGAAVIDSNAQNITISQSIAHSMELGDNPTDGGLTKIGTGSVTLSGTNTYNGNTLINEGALTIASTAALPGWDTNSRYSVANGATLAVTNAIADGNIATMLGTTNFAAGAAIGFDTTTANRTYAATVTDTAQGALGLTKLGTNTLTLPVANSYSGTTTVANGELSIQNAGSLGTTTGATTVVGGNRLVLDGGITVTGEPASLSGNGTDFFGALQSKTGVNQWTGNITIAANDTRIGARSGSSIEISGVIDSGINNHLVTFRPENTTATVIVSGANTYVGPTTLTGGLVTVSSINSVVGGTPSSNLGAPTAGNGTIKFGAAEGSGINYIGTGEITDRAIDLAGTTQGGRIDQSGTGELKFTSAFTATGLGSKTLTLQGSTAGTGVIAGAIVDNSGTNKTSLAKAGSGTWTLSGTNTYTGTTAVNAGTLKLDYGSGADTTKLSDTGALTLGGGTLELVGGTHPELVLSTTLTAGTVSKLVQTGGSAVLQMNTITRGAGASIDFSTFGIATTENTNTNGIIGAWATVGGSDWATNSTDLPDGLITAYSSYTDLDNDDVIADGGTTNIRINSNGGGGSMTLGSLTTSVNTLLQSNASQPAIIDLQSTNTLATSGIMIGTTAKGLTVGAVANDGILTATTAGGDLLFRNNSITELLTINSSIANNTSASSITKVGVGTLILAGTNTYTGATTVLEGTLKAGSATAFNNATTLAVAPGATFDLNGFDAEFASMTSTTGTITTTGAGSGTDTLTISASNVDGIGNLFTDNGTRQLKIDLTSTSSPAAARLATTNVNNTYSGGLVLGNLMRAVVPAGTVGTPGAIVSGALGRGTVTINGGLLNSDGAQIYFNATNRTLVNHVIVNGNAGNGSRAGSIRIQSAGSTITGNVTANAVDAWFGSDAAAGTVLTVNGQLTGPSGFRFFQSSGANAWKALLNNLTVNPNDYAGPTAINSAQTTLALGAPDQIPNGAGKGNVILTSGTLDLAGFNETINGLTYLTTGGTVDNVTAANANNTLTLGDGNATASFAGVIKNTTGSLALTKTGTGTQTLSGANEYGGTTTINNGTLLVNGNQSLATGPVQVHATLGGTGTIGGVVTVASGGKIAPGTEGTIETLDIAADASIAGTLACDVDGATTDVLAVVGNLILTGSTLAINPINPGTPNTHVIATYTGARTGTLGGTLPAGYSVNYDDTNKEVELVIAATGGYDAWVITNTVTEGENGDDDKDGISNLVEYALGLNPKIGNPAPGTFVGNLLTFNKGTEAKTALDVTYILETSTTLGNGSWVTAVGAVNGTDAISYQLPANEPGGKLFARLKVTRP